jgi:RNA polymerase sigma factor (sigma-70 family)
MHTGGGLTGVVRHLRHQCGDATNDGELLARFAGERDESAFAELVRRHGGLVLGVARRQLADREQAEDVFQATFLALARQAPRLGRPPSLVNWLYTVALRQARKTRLAASRRATRDARLTPPSSPADPLAEVSGRELVALIDEELARLPEAYRLPLLLCGLHGLGRDEAARRLGWTAGAVKGRLERGRELLRRRLEKRGLTVPAVLAGVLAADAAGAAPPELVATTMRVALTAAPATWGPVRALAAAALLLVATGVGAGLASAPGSRPRRPTDPAPPAPAVAAGARAEPDSDPLPDGALLRLGTTRFRMHGFCYAPDGRSLVTVRGGAVAFLDPDTGRELRRWPPAPLLAQSFAVAAPVQFSPGGRSALLSGHRHIELWDAATGQRRYDLSQTGRRGSESRWAVFFPDGRRVLTAGRLFRSGESSEYTIWDVATGDVVRHLPRSGHIERYNADCDSPIRFTADDKTLVECPGVGVARLVDTDTGRVVRSFENAASMVFRLSADRKSLISLGTDFPGRDASIRQWDVATGREEPPFDGRVKAAKELAQTDDGRLLAWTEDYQTIRLLDLTAGRELRPIDLAPHRGGSALRFAPDGRSLWAQEGFSLWRRFDVASGRELTHPVEGPRGGVIDMAVAPDGQTLYTGGPRELTAWDLTTGAVRRRFTTPPAVWSQHVALSPDGATLASGDINVPTVQLWDTATGALRLSFEGRGQYVYRLGIDPTGRWLAVAGDFREDIHLHDLRNGRHVRTLANSNGFWGLAFSPDGRSLVAMDRSAHYGRTCEWDVATGRVRRVLSDWPLYGLTYSPDGRTVVGSALGPNANLSSVYVLEVATGRRRFAPSPTEPLRHYPSVAFAPDGRLLAVACGPQIAVWDTLTGERRLEFTDPDSAVGVLRFVRGGRALAARRVWTARSSSGTWPAGCPPPNRPRPRRVPSWKPPGSGWRPSRRPPRSRRSAAWSPVPKYPCPSCASGCRRPRPWTPRTSANWCAGWTARASPTGRRPRRSWSASATGPPPGCAPP